MSNIIVHILIFIISFIDRFERNDQKLIKTFDLRGIKIKTDTGFKDVSNIYLTRPYDIYSIELENGMWLDAADNHIVFDEKLNEVFVKDLSVGDLIWTEDGPIKIRKIKHSSKKICMCDITVDDKNHRFYSNGILSHNTTTSALFMLHYICFNFDKNALVLGNKRKTAVEILDKAKKIFVELPYFLRPGVYKWNEAEIVLDNGCRLMAEATTINSGISFTFHCVLADEFGHIAPNILDKFYENLFPTITAAKARFMITSTQNGYNLFYRIYKAAEAGENEYAPFKVDWWQIPEWNPEKKCWEPRTEAWHRLQVANYGSEEAFNRQFGTDFDVDVNTLVNKKVLKKTQENTIEFINKDLPGVSLSDNYYWKPDYDPQSQLRRDYIIICGDLAEGVERDYTHFNICRFVEPESGKIECVGYYRSNDVDRRDIAKSIMELSAIQCNMDHLLLSFERNTYGELFLKHIEEFDEKGVVPGFDNGVLVKYFNESGTKYEYGAKISRGNKNNMCLLFKEDYEKNNIINQSTVFCSELLNFSDPEDKGVWKAAFGHDDAVMSMVQLEYVKQTLQYILLKQEFDSQKPETESTAYNPYLDMYSWLPSQQFDSIYSFGDTQTSINSNRLR